MIAPMQAQSFRIVRFVIAILLAGAGIAGCGSAVPTSPASTFAPSAATSPTSSSRPAPAPDAPAIADPYWLGEPSTDHGVWKNAKRKVIRTDDGKSYAIYRGGWIDGTILMNGDWVGAIDWTVTKGDDG